MAKKKEEKIGISPKIEKNRILSENRKKIGMFDTLVSVIFPVLM